MKKYIWRLPLSHVSLIGVHCFASWVHKVIPIKPWAWLQAKPVIKASHTLWLCKVWVEAHRSHPDSFYYFPDTFLSIFSYHIFLALLVPLGPTPFSSISWGPFALISTGCLKQLNTVSITPSVTVSHALPSNKDIDSHLEVTDTLPSPCLHVYFLVKQLLFQLMECPQKCLGTEPPTGKHPRRSRSGRSTDSPHMLGCPLLGPLPYFLPPTTRCHSLIFTFLHISSLLERGNSYCGQESCSFLSPVRLEASVLVLGSSAEPLVIQVPAPERRDEEPFLYMGCIHFIIVPATCCWLLLQSSTQHNTSG